jgi:hypothetical protein
MHCTLRKSNRNAQLAGNPVAMAWQKHCQRNKRGEHDMGMQRLPSRGSAAEVTKCHFQSQWSRQWPETWTGNNVAEAADAAQHTMLREEALLSVSCTTCMTQPGPAGTLKRSQVVPAVPGALRQWMAPVTCQASVLCSAPQIPRLKYATDALPAARLPPIASNRLRATMPVCYCPKGCCWLSPLPL